MFVLPDDRSVTECIICPDENIPSTELIVLNQNAVREFVHVSPSGHTR